MAARRGKSQAKRHGGNNHGLPGWAWLVMGVLLALGAVLIAPKFIGNDDSGFFRADNTQDNDPPPALDATSDNEPIVAEDSTPPAADAGEKDAETAPPKETDYDFYTLLPGEETAISDSELAASARAEAARDEAARIDVARAETTQVETGTIRKPPADVDAPPPAIDTAPTPRAETTRNTTRNTTSNSSATTAPAAASDARYLLQAGAFGASGDAEALKAKIAFLGLGARVESAQIKGQTVYRVRMGPYGSASELAEAKQKLANGGLPAMAIRVK